MTSMRMRIATPDDAEAVAGLARRAYAKWVPVLGRPPRPMVEDYTAAIADHRIDLHERNGRLIASLETRNEPDYLYLVSVAVDPEFQGQGIGLKLLTHAEALAREAGHAEVRLKTHGLMEFNVVFYQRHGYEVFERETHETYGTVVHLRKVLSQSM